MSAPVDAVPRDYNFAADILKRNLDAGRGEKVAYIDHRGSYSYAALAARVERFGHVLRALDVRREERVLMCLLDTIDWPTAFLGAIKAGVVAVPVNTLLTEDDYRFMLEDSRARVLVVSEELLPKFAKAVETSKHLAHVIVSGDKAQQRLLRVCLAFFMLLSVVGLVSLYTFRERFQEPPGPATNIVDTRHATASNGRPVQ